MNDGLPVRLVERLQYCRANRQRLLYRERSSLEAVGQRLSLHVLHHEEVGAVVFADVVQRADVRMRETGDRSRLAFEALLHVGLHAELRRQHFDRDGPAQAGVDSLVDLSHPATADGRQDLVRSKARAGGKGHRGQS